MSVTNLHCKLFLERMLKFIIIHHKFSLPSTSLVLAACKSSQGNRNVLYTKREGYYVSIRQTICSVAILELLGRNNDILKLNQVIWAQMRYKGSILEVNSRVNMDGVWLVRLRWMIFQVGRVTTVNWY